MTRHGLLDFGSLDDFFNQLFKDPNFFSSEISGCTLYPETFPPANIILKANKNLIFNFAVAGYTQDDIELSFEGDNMVLEFKKLKSEIDESDVYLTHNIKTSGKKNRYKVPYSKYATDKTTAKMQDGILEIIVPAKEEERPRKVKIEI